MSASPGFAVALEVVLRLEGGFANHPSDPGGATNMGITHTTLAGWRRVPVAQITVDDVRALTREEAAAIYEAGFWRTGACDAVAAAGLRKLALAHFDWAVNGGVGRARWYLQAALNLGCQARLLVDGKIGPATRAALEQCDPADERPTIDAYLALRWAHYRLRATAGGEAERAQLAAAGLSRFGPTPYAPARQWLPVWRNRLRRIAIACGLPPFPPLP